MNGAPRLYIVFLPFYSIYRLPVCAAQFVGRLTEEPEVPGSISGLAHTYVEIYHEIYFTIIHVQPSSDSRIFGYHKVHKTKAFKSPADFTS